MGAGRPGELSPSMPTLLGMRMEFIWILMNPEPTTGHSISSEGGVSSCVCRRFSLISRNASHHRRRLRRHSVAQQKGNVAARRNGGLMRLGIRRTNWAKTMRLVLIYTKLCDPEAVSHGDFATQR